MSYCLHESIVAGAHGLRCEVCDEPLLEIPTDRWRGTGGMKSFRIESGGIEAWQATALEGPMPEFTERDGGNLP